MEPQALEALRDPRAWPHPVDSVELIETHISWVFLTGEFAYKIKKPVNFGFLDFSTLEKRKFCCEEELRLNSRLAAEIYLAVVPVTRGVPAVGGKGEILDYAVKMRQFDTRCGFDRLLARGELTPRQIDEAAAVLAAFHGAAAVAGADSGFGNAAAAAAPVLENFDQVRPCLGDQRPDQLARFELLERWSRGACERFAGAFDRRLAGGFVRECHGDLHLRNIVYWQGKVLPFDCIEFNPALRWIDIISEMAFLLMDLDDHGSLDLSRRLLSRWLEYTGDYAGLALLRFYQVYRAMVRVKVESLRLAQLDNADEDMKSELGKYLELAAGYTRDTEPRLLIAHGLSGSGKTHVARLLLEQADLVHLRSDVERKRLFGLGPLDSSRSAQDEGIYSREANVRTYEHLADLAGRLLDSGWSVLVDAAFLKVDERRAFRQLAESRGMPFAIMHCEADMGVQRQRIAGRRGDASEADLGVLERQREWQEPLRDAELPDVLSVNTTAAPDLAALLAFLASGEILAGQGR